MVGEAVVADDTSLRLDIYKTAVEMADRLSARRAGVNTFFVTLNTALAAVVGIVSSARKPPPHGNLPSFDPIGLIITAFAGIVFSLVWWLLLRYYRRLSKAKWDVINALETCFPVHPFTDEWKNMYPGDTLPVDREESKDNKWWNRIGEWWATTRHREATAVEQVVPWVFVVVYLILVFRVAVQ